MVNVFLEERKEKNSVGALVVTFSLNGCKQDALLTKPSFQRSLYLLINAIKELFFTYNRVYVVILTGTIQPDAWSLLRKIVYRRAMYGCAKIVHVRLCMDGQPLETFSSRGQKPLASPQCKAISYPMR